jgi:hypothetical protein
MDRGKLIMMSIAGTIIIPLCIFISFLHYGIEHALLLSVASAIVPFSSLIASPYYRWVVDRNLLLRYAQFVILDAILLCILLILFNIGIMSIIYLSAYTLIPIISISFYKWNLWSKIRALVDMEKIRDMALHGSLKDRIKLLPRIWIFCFTITFCGFISLEIILISIGTRSLYRILYYLIVRDLPAAALFSTTMTIVAFIAWYLWGRIKYGG